MKINPEDKAGLFLMNQKGLSVLRTFLAHHMKDRIAFVSVGRDQAVITEYAAEIFELASVNDIPVFERNSDHPHSTLNVAVGWRWIIRTTQPLIVIHDSLLPRYRGFAPLVNMLINGENKLGATLLWASEAYDQGPVIAAESVTITHPIRIDAAIESVITCYSKLTEFLRASLQSGRIPQGTPQHEIGATYGLWRDQQDYQIDWSKSSDEILRHIYALGPPYPYAQTLCNNVPIEILDAQTLPDVKIENRTPGKVIFNHQDGCVVVCGSGLLKPTSMQKDGVGF